MKKLLLYTLIIFILALSLIQSATKDTLLTIKQPQQDFYTNFKKGTDPNIKTNPESFIVIGNIENPDLNINNIDNILLLDQDGKELPLMLDKSSVYSEFDDEFINAVTIKFYLPKAQITKGPLRLMWGSDINANNKLVKSFALFESHKNIYKTFITEKIKPLDDMSYSTTIDVIIDDYADKYYLWYLLPIILIFLLLFLRRFFR